MMRKEIGDELGIKGILVVIWKKFVMETNG
jgi:hypothetical protein